MFTFLLRVHWMVFNFNLACVFQQVEHMVFLFCDFDRVIYTRRRGVKHQRKVENFCRSTAEPYGFTAKRPKREAVRSARRLSKTVINFNLGINSTNKRSCLLKIHYSQKTKKMLC